MKQDRILSIPSNQRRPFRILQPNPASCSRAQNEAITTFQDPHEGKEGKGESRPVDEAGRALVCEDGEEGPADGDGGGQVAFGGGEGVGSGGGFEEE